MTLSRSNNADFFIICALLLVSFNKLSSANAPTALTAVLSLQGAPVICSGQDATFQIVVTGGGAPFNYIYSINGIPQPVASSNTNPIVFTVPITVNTTVTLLSLTANGITSSASGSASVTVAPSLKGIVLHRDTTLCNGQSDTVRFKFHGTAPFLFVYSENGVNHVPIATPDSTYAQAVTPMPGINLYKLTSVQANGCLGLTTGIDTIRVLPTPTATITGDTTICPGTAATLTLHLTGTKPFIVKYTANGLPQSTIIADTTLYTFQVMPSQGTTYVVTDVIAHNCPGTVSGQATVNIGTGPTATLSGGGQICQSGTGTTIVFTLTGTAPWTFVYSANNIVQPPVTTSDPIFIVDVNPSIGTIFNLISVHDATCTGVASGTAIVFVFTPPTAVMTGTQVFCDSAATNVSVDFTGTGPFTFTYTIDGVPQTPINTFDDPYLIPATTKTTTTYLLTSVSSPGCVGLPTGSATLTVQYTPTYNNVLWNCNPAGFNYTVEFDVTGTPPFTLVTGSGTFTGLHFVSNPIPQAQGFNFVFHDANNCNNVSVAGTSTCNCTTKAGTMVLTPINACVGQTATATHNNDFVNDGNDVLRFMLHTKQGIPAGTILGWSATPSFSNIAGVIVGTTYYISPVAGNPDGTGNPDPTDPCYSLGQGTPVVFHSLPSAIPGPDVSICAGSKAQIQVKLTGLAPYSLQWTENGTAVSALNLPGPTYLLSLQPIGNTEIVLQTVNDSLCPAPLNDTIHVNLMATPQITQTADNCNHEIAAYTVEFDAIGLQPFLVSGLPGAFTGNHFTSTPLASGATYNLTLTDVNNCGSATLSGSSICACLTNAGTLDLTPLSVCANDTARAIFHNDYFNDGNDLVRFILYTAPGTPPGTILTWSPTPNFPFLNGVYQPGVTYYISAISGNSDGAGNIDLTDPCLSVSNGVPVTFHNLPTAQLGSDITICKGSTAYLQVALTGQAPYMLNWTVNGTHQSIGNIPGNTYLLSFQPLVSSTVILQSVSDGFCSTPTNDTATIIVDQPVQIANQKDSCDYTNGVYIVSFDITGTPPYTIYGVIGQFDGTHFSTEPMLSGTPYDITITDNSTCGQVEITGAPSCPCKADAGSLATTPQVLCINQTAMVVYQAGSSPVLAIGDTVVYELLSSSFTPIAFNGQPSFVFDPATMSPDSVYTIVALVGKILLGGGALDFTDGCLSTAIGSTVVWRTTPTAAITGNATICPGNPASLQVDFTGSGPFTFTYSANGTQKVITTSVNPYFINENPTVPTSYLLVDVTGAGGCPGAVSGSGQVDIEPLPQVVNLTSSCNFYTSTYTLQFDISNGASPNQTYSVTGIPGTLTDTTFVSGPISFGLPYNITVTDATGCTVVATGNISCQCGTHAGTLNGAQLNACLPDGLVHGIYNNDGTLDANDTLVYVLCQNPALLPQGILAIGNTPDFGFQAGMVAGTKYYLVVVAGNPAAGAIDWTDPCLSKSPGTAVVFHNLPSASMQGDTAICRGKSYSFKILFQGTPPFKFVYAINGVPQIPITAPQASFNVSTNNVQQKQVFTLVSVQDAYCTGTAIGTVTVKVLENLTGALSGDATICAGDSAMIALKLTGADSFYVSISGGNTPIHLTNFVNGQTFAVFPAASTTYTIDSISAIGNHCPFNIGKDATITVTNLALSGATSDYHGFGISCADMSDGTVTLSTTGGTVPITASWSNGSSGLTASNLLAGSYTVTVTDNTGCTAVQNFNLTAPLPLDFSIKSRNPKCTDQHKGTLTIGAATGGVPPYMVSVNGAVAQGNTFPLTIDQLADGPYTVEVTDGNGCTSSQQANITSPPLPAVDLGPDLTQYPGDSTLLTGILHVTQLDTFYWSPTQFMSNPGDLTTYVKPEHTQAYTLTVQDTSGCKASDQVLVVVKKTPRVFVPNVFHPGSANARNEYFTVYGGPEVVRVHHMQVFDRWGDLVFENRDFPPNSPKDGWDGRYAGKDVNPGVFIYVIELELIKGDTDTVSGDITVVR